MVKAMQTILNKAIATTAGVSLSRFAEDPFGTRLLEDEGLLWVFLAMTLSLNPNIPLISFTRSVTLRIRPDKLRTTWHSVRCAFLMIASQIKRTFKECAKSYYRELVVRVAPHL